MEDVIYMYVFALLQPLLDLYLFLASYSEETVVLISIVLIDYVKEVSFPQFVILEFIWNDINMMIETSMYLIRNLTKLM